MTSAFPSQPGVAGQDIAEPGAPSAARSARPLVGEGAATLILVALIIGAIAWILLDTVPRFRTAPQNTLWDTSSQPTAAVIEPGAPVELGVVFRARLDGIITGLRFYKVAGNDGPHVGSLWSADGELLATVTFEDESGLGWQEARFETPVAVEPKQMLVASYFAPVGGEAVGSASVFGANQPKPSGSGSLRLLTGRNRPANVYREGGPGFPTQAAGDQSFWLDVMFVPELGLE